MSRKTTKSTDAVRRRAVLKRFEQMIGLLRTCHICEGWRLDEEAVARSLRYLRHLVDGGRNDAREWQALMDFLSQHGQSIDWILVGDPVGMITHAAAHSRQAWLGMPARRAA
jgi:hypothetical protein